MKYVESSKGINFNEYNYLKKMFGLIKIGTELEFEFNSGTTIRYSDIRQNMGVMTNGFSTFGTNTCGVAEVKSDGSLRNGCEIVTTGRLLHSPTLFHSQYTNIFNSLPNVPNVSNRTGMHQHMLIAEHEGNSELEISFNNTVFKNFIILFKKHYVGLMWLCSALNDEAFGDKTYTRYSGFSKVDALFSFNVNSVSSMNDLKRKLTVGGRYHALNVSPMKISSSDKLTNFHIEFRYPDGAVCPSQVVMQNFMHEGLLKYALDVSLGGELVDDNDTRQVFELKNNQDGGDYPSDSYRFSDNSNLDLIYMGIKAHDLCSALQNYIPASVYECMRNLSDKNISMKLEDKTIEQIEEELSAYFKPTSGVINESIVRMILDGTINIDTLEKATIDAEMLKVDIEDVKVALSRLKSTGLL